MSTKTYVLDELDWEKFSSLMSVLDSVQIEDKFILYVDSYGWAQTYFCALSDRLNDMVREWFSIEVVVMTAGSMALQLVWEFEGKIRLARFCEWLAHVVAQADSATYFSQWITKIRTSDPLRIWRQKEDAKREPFDYPFLNWKESEDYTEWRDVYLSETRMKEIFAERQLRNAPTNE